MIDVFKKDAKTTTSVLVSDQCFHATRRWGRPHKDPHPAPPVSLWDRDRIIFFLFISVALFVLPMTEWM